MFALWFVLCTIIKGCDLVKLHKIVAAALSIILVISLLCTSVFGAVGGTITYSTIKFGAGLNNISQNGVAQIIDADTFLSYALTAFSSNVMFEEYFKELPFGVQRIAFNGDQKHYMCVYMKTGDVYFKDSYYQHFSVISLLGRPVYPQSDQHLMWVTLSAADFPFNSWAYCNGVSYTGGSSASYLLVASELKGKSAAERVTHIKC